MANTHAPTANPASKNNGNISCKYKALMVKNHRQIEVSNGGMIEGRTFTPHATRPLAISLWAPMGNTSVRVDQRKQLDRAYDNPRKTMTKVGYQWLEKKFNSWGVSLLLVVVIILEVNGGCGWVCKNLCVDVRTEDSTEVVAGVAEGTPHTSNRYPTGNIAHDNDSNLNLLVVVYWKWSMSNPTGTLTYHNKTYDDKWMWC